jgi:hypothetical protein
MDDIAMIAEHSGAVLGGASAQESMNMIEDNHREFPYDS